jgi:hypothetical protein
MITAAISVAVTRQDRRKRGFVNTFPEQNDLLLERD